MDVRFINPFVKSICNTFTTMCDLNVTVGKPQLVTDDACDADISAIIGFSGDAAGSVIVKYNFDVACKIASSFAKVEMDRNHPDLVDALGELANMIAGGAKAQFEGLDVDISLPSVVVGSHHHFPVARNAQRLILPCQTAIGTFETHVAMILTKVEANTPAAASGASL